MIPYPMVMTTMNASRDAGTPLVMKLFTVRYLFPTSSVMEIAVTLGNPEEARPIPQEASNVHPNTRIGAALPDGNLSPISCTRGMIIIAETVCDTKVPTTSMTIPKIHKMA